MCENATVAMASFIITHSLATVCVCVCVCVCIYVLISVTVLWRHVSGQHASSQVARNHLAGYYHESNRPARINSPTIICLLDELDFLLTKDENVVYSFVDWPLSFQSNLVVVGISNVMDLPERLSSR